MWNCPNCKEACDDFAESCWNCGRHSMDYSPPTEPPPKKGSTSSLHLDDRVWSTESSPEKGSAVSPQPSLSKGARNALMSRYRDSYLVARTVTAFGEVVKIIASVIGGVILLIALIAGGQSAWYFFGGIILAAVVGIPIYVLGVLVTAQGQILKATLDTAVNSSPLLTKDEMRQIMSLD